MMDIIGSVLREASIRTRSSFFASVLLSFSLINWQPLFYLVFADQDAAVKIRFAMMHFTFVSVVIFPLISGIIIFAATPWIAVATTALYHAPTLRMAKLQEAQKLDKQLHSLRTEIEVENKKSELVARKQDALVETAEKIRALGDTTGNPDLDALKSKIVAAQDTEEQKALSKGELESLKMAARYKSGEIMFDDVSRAIPRMILDGVTHGIESREAFVRLHDNLESLVRKGLMEKNRSGAFRISVSGYDYLKRSERP